MKTSSLKQIAANRENAKKSTGPKTPAGKAASSRNALRHGLYSTDLVLPSEDFEEFKAFARRLNEAYAPRDALEEEVVRDIVMVRVRLRRFERVELELYQTYGYYEGENRGEGLPLPTTQHKETPSQSSPEAALLRVVSCRRP
jgi:hypothetical protein